jgi:hypothetical protein
MATNSATENKAGQTFRSDVEYQSMEVSLQGNHLQTASSCRR